MIETVSTQLKAIAFERDIQRLTEGFTGREWVFKEIDRWLQQENERFFILTGEPGVGKSAITAQLTQIRQDVAAYHFCIAGRSGTIEPNNVLLSLAAQLIKYFPDYAEAFVNSIKPLRLSVKVEITIESIKDSTVQGVVINNLHTQNPQEALNIVLRRSLGALPSPPEQPRLILIDSLDEAVTFSDRDNLVTLLAGLEDLPDWVRLLLTSRPEDRVLVEFEPLASYGIKKMSARNLADIQEYVKKRVEQPALQDQINKAALGSQALIDEITKLSSGNFLYTKLLLNDIEAERQSLNDLSALPKSIDDIYLAFLRRFKSQEWRNQYQPILGALTVTQEPVTEDDLANFTGIRPRILRQNLGIIRQFLDVVENSDCSITYAIFHQSLRDYLLNKKRNKYFWCDAQEQHELIIEYYERISRSWQQLQEIDRYGLHHLAQHLVKAEHIEKLHALLAMETLAKHNAWFEVKDKISDVSGFIADINLAWKQVDMLFESVKLSEDVSQLLGLQCRYALIIASVNSMISEIPTKLFIELIKQQLWSAKRGLAYIRKIPYSSKQAETLTEVIPYLPKSLLPEVLSIVKSIKDELYLVDTLIALFPYLNKELLLKSLELVLLIQDEEKRIKILTALVSFLPESWTVAYEAALAIQKENLRAKILIALAPFLPEVLPEAYKAALAIEQKSERVHALTGLVSLLPEALPEACKTALSIQYSDEILCFGATAPAFELPRFLALKNLIPYQPQILKEAIITAFNIQDPYFSISCITDIADYLPNKIILKAFYETLTIQPEKLRLRLLRKLLPYLTKNLPEILEVIERLKPEEFRILTRTYLAAHMPEESLRQLLDLVLNMQNQYLQILSLESLVPQVSEALPEILTAITKYDDEGLRTQILMNLSPYLSKEKLLETLAIVKTIQNKSDRGKVLTELGYHIPEILLEALRTVQSIGDKNIQIVAFACLSNYLLSKRTEVLENIQTMQDWDLQNYAIESIKYYIPEEDRVRIQSKFQNRKRQEEDSHAYNMTILVANTPEILPQVIETSFNIHDEKLRAQALINLVLYIPEILPEALKAAQAIQDETLRTLMFSMIDSYLSSNNLQVEEINTTTPIYSHSVVYPSNSEQGTGLVRINITNWKCEPKDLHAHSLVKLVPYMPEVLTKAVEAARSIKDVDLQAKALVSLLQYIPEVLPEALNSVLLMPKNQYRAQLLVCLLRYKEDIVAEAFEAIQEFTEHDWYSSALMILAPHLSEKCILKAFEATQTIRLKNLRVQALIALAPYQPDAVLEALKLLQIQWQVNESLRIPLLERLVPHLVKLEPNQLLTVWKHIIHSFSARMRCELLEAIAHFTSVIYTLGKEKAVEAVFEEIQRVGHWWP